ncbi:MAG: hypothetical protein AAGA83_13700 [Cyanobacteria bacterium P01_F01_bin.116]
MKPVKGPSPSSPLSNALVFALCSCLLYCPILLLLAPWPTAAKDVWINGLAGVAVSFVEVVVWIVYFLPKFVLSKSETIAVLGFLLLAILLIFRLAILSLLRQSFPGCFQVWEQTWAVEKAPDIFWWVLLIITLNSIVIAGISVAYDWPGEYFRKDFLPAHVLPAMIWGAQMAIFLAYVVLGGNRVEQPPIIWPTNLILVVLISFSLCGLVLYNQLIPRYTLSRVTPFLESYLQAARAQPTFGIINRDYGVYHVRGYHTFSDGSIHFVLSQPFPRFNHNEVIGLAYRPNISGSSPAYYPLNSDWKYFELKTENYAGLL